MNATEPPASARPGARPETSGALPSADMPSADVSPDVPSPHMAAGLLAEAERLRGAVGDAARTRYVAWLVGVSVATTGYYAALAVAGRSESPEEGGVFIASSTFGALVVVLSLTLLPGARINSRGFGRRWVTAVAGWGVLYSVTLVLGLLVFPTEPAFWLPAAAVTVAPLVDGARREMRA